MKPIYSVLSLLLIANLSLAQSSSQEISFSGVSFSSSATKTNPFTGTTNLCLTVTNAGIDNLHINFYGRKKNSSVSTATPANSTASTGKFTIILLPDTQFYTAEPQGTNGGNNAMFKRQIRWIVNNRARKNIVFVGQLGDCSQNGNTYEVEWKRGDTAIKPLEDSAATGLKGGIPYGICVGNHDQSPNGSAAGTTTFFNKYFGSERFKGRPYYGGHFSTNNDNSYELFNVGTINFLVIHFEYDPSTTNFTKVGGALDWGENLIKSYPDRNVIVLSHYVLKADGTFSVQGNNIYQRFKIYPNFKFMSGGHVVDSAESMRKDVYNGNTVYTVLSNYQGRENGGNGRLRIYEFDPSTNNVSVKTYSPYTSTYETDASSQFNMNISLITNTNLSSPVASANLSSANSFHLVGKINNVPSGTNICVPWSSLEENTDYEWYAEVSDGNNKIASSTWSFTTGQNKELPPAIKQKESFIIYPNPNTINNFTLYFNKEIKGKMIVEIFNETGVLLLQREFSNVNKTLSVAHNLPAGTYIVTVRTENSTDQKKLIVIK